MENAYENVRHLIDNELKFIFYDEGNNMEEYLKDDLAEKSPYRYTVDMDITGVYLAELKEWKKEGYDKRKKALEAGTLPSEFYSQEYDYYVWFKNSDIALFDDEQLSELIQTLKLFDDRHSIIYIQVNTMTAGEQLSKILNLNAYYVAWSDVNLIATSTKEEEPLTKPKKVDEKDEALENPF